MLLQGCREEERIHRKIRRVVKEKWRRFNFPTFGVGIFCWTSAQHLTHTHAIDHRGQYFPPHFTRTRETWTCTEGAENQVCVCHSCQRCGFVPISKCPESGRGGSAGSALLMERQCTRCKAPRPAATDQSPDLSCPCVAGVVEILRTLSQGQEQGAQGDLLASSAWHQAELSLTPYSCHLCLSVQINTITLNP